MRPSLAVALLSVFFLTACEGTKIRLMNPHPPGTAAYLYDDAFYSLRNNHDLFQRLKGAAPGQLRATMADIMNNLETMLRLLEEPLRADFQPIVESHRKIQQESVDRGPVSAGVYLAMDNLWRQVNKRFYPEGVKLKAVPAAEGAAAPPAAPAPPETAPPVPGWMAATAWRQSHAALASAWPKEPAAAAAAFAKAREALAALKGTASEEAAPMLQIYLNEYDRLASQTASFSKVPAGQTAEGVTKALGAVGKGVEAHLPKQ